MEKSQANPLDNVGDNVKQFWTMLVTAAADNIFAVSCCRCDRATNHLPINQSGQKMTSHVNDDIDGDN